MKYKDPITGELRDVIIKSGDTLPIGTIVDFDGDTIPDGYEEATDASYVVDTLDGNETTMAPSVRAVKEDLNTYSTEEQVIGTWMGKPLYRKVISHTITGSSQELEPHNISNIDRVISIKNSLINQYGYFMANEPTISANMDAFNINITSEWATGFTYFIIEYTKTTD